MTSSLRNKLLTLLASVVIASVTAQAQHLVQFTSPTPSTELNDGTLQVTIHVDAPALPSSLYVEANGKDVTRYFHTAGCHSAPCEFTATLNANVLHPGWNYLATTVHSEHAAVDSDHVRVYNQLGSLSATTGYAAPFTVKVIAKEQAVEVGYSPETGLTPANYPYLKGTRCAPGDLFLLTLDRSSLSFKRTTCYGTGANTSLVAYLSTLTKTDLVIGGNSGPGYHLGPLDLSKIGGTNFTASGAPTAWGYSIVGFGGASTGLAYESYTTTQNGPWVGVQGDLVDIASTTPLYCFRPTDSPAFVVQPSTTTATGSAKITVGYARTFPIGNGGEPDNFTLPASFTNATYNSPACSTSCAGAVWVLIFDSMTMQFVSSNTYATNSAINLSEMARFANDINAFRASDVTANKVVFLTTIGSAFGAVTDPSTSTAYASKAMVDAVGYLGVSPNAFNQLLFGGQFSMVGIPGSTPVAGQTMHPIDKWYSSTQQPGDTGSLSGLLTRNHRFKFVPADVGSITIQKSNPSADDLLSFAIPAQLAVAPSVPWPDMGTVGLRNAYAYLSDYMQRHDYFGGKVCRLSINQCEDIRFRYTSGEMNNIIKGVDPGAIPFPDEAAQGAKKFTETEFDKVAAQLKDEKQYLSNVSSYQLALTQINTNATMNVGAALQAAATNVSTKLNEAIGSPANSSKLQLATDMVGTVGALIGSVGPVFPPASVAAGLLGGSAGMMSIFNNSKNAPDPYVTQLSDLLAKQGGVASDYATNFNTQIQASTGMFFNSTYADWFKLQTIGLMSVIPGSGWNFPNAGNAMTDFNSSFIARARNSFYQQTVPQYFNQIRLRDYQFYYYTGTEKSKNDNAAEQNAGYLPKLLDRHYSWNYWPSPGAPKCKDYVYMVTTNSRIQVPSYLGDVKSWSSEFGTLLMGPTGAGTTSDLGIPREYFYDTLGFKVAFDTQARFEPKNYCTKR